MWRLLLTLLAAGAVGSLIGTAGFILMVGWADAASFGGVVQAFAAGTMIFTVPGAMMLMGAHAFLRERGLTTMHRGALVVSLGAVAGALVFALISRSMAGLGALYGLATAFALLGVQRLLAGATRPVE
jgi:hypothetical protein